MVATAVHAERRRSRVERPVTATNSIAATSAPPPTSVASTWRRADNDDDRDGPLGARPATTPATPYTRTSATSVRPRECTAPATAGAPMRTTRPNTMKVTCMTAAYGDPEAPNLLTVSAAAS